MQPERERERRDDKCVGLFEKRTEITVGIDEEHLHKCRCNQKRRHTLGPEPKGSRWRTSEEEPREHPHREPIFSFFGCSGGEAAAALSPCGEGVNVRTNVTPTALGLWRTQLWVLLSPNSGRRPSYYYCYTALFDLPYAAGMQNRLITFSIRENSGEKQPVWVA